MSDVSRGEDWWQASDGKWYPPEAPPPLQPQTPGFQEHPNVQPLPIRPLHRRGWFWPVIAVVIVIAGCKAIEIGAGVSNRQEAHQVNTVVYSVTGSSSAVDVTYQTEKGPTQASDAALPWKRTVEITGISAFLNLWATVGAGGGSIRCTIVDDGAVVVTDTARGASATASCRSTTG